MFQIIKNCVYDFSLGLYDSLNIFTIARFLNNTNIYKNIIIYLILNCLLYFVFIKFYFVFIEPMINFISLFIPFGAFIHSGIYYFYIFWLIIIYFICNVISSNIVDEVYNDSIEMIENIKVEYYNQRMFTRITNSLFRIGVILSYFIYILILKFIPKLPYINYITISILNSLYVFQFILIKKSISDIRNIFNFIEYKIFYFIGYGLIISIFINSFETITFQSVIFLLIFPFYLIASIRIYNKRFNLHKFDNNKVVFLYFSSMIYDLFKNTLLGFKNFIPFLNKI